MDAIMDGFAPQCKLRRGMTDIGKTYDRLLTAPVVFVMIRPMRKMLPLVALFFVAATAHAQTQVPEKQIEIQKQEQGSQESATQAAREAKRARLGEGSDVTWDQVLAHPDDIDLNYRFALTQIKQGNLRGAAATLERLLMINPALDQVRLVYAIVLFRLDSIDESARELDTLSKESLPEDMRAEVRDYQAQIEKKRRKTHISAALSLGYGFDDNKNFAPSAGYRLINFSGQDVQIPLTGSSLRQFDQDGLGIANIRITRDLPSEDGHQVFANLSYLRDEQVHVNYLNVQAYSAQIGGVYKTAFANFTPTANFDHVQLGASPQTFLRDRGAGLQMDKTLTSKLVGHAETIYTYQDFVNDQTAPTATLRSGPQYEAYVGGDYVLTPTMRVGSTIGWLHKLAVARFYTYNRGSLQLTDTWLLGKGMFLASSLTVNLDYYQEEDPAISPTTPRRDKTIIPQFIYGVPLGWIAKPLDTTLFTLTYRYYHALSTVPNYAYTDNRVAGAFIYQFNY